MGRQAQKRYRHQQQVRQIRPTIEGRSGTRLDEQVWLYRRADEASSEELLRAAQYAEGDGIRPKLRGYTLSLFHPADVNMTIKRSPLRGFVRSKSVYEHVDFEELALHNQAVEVSVKGLEKYGFRRPKIGITVESAELEQEYDELANVMHRYLDTKPTRRKPRFHITLAHGELGDLQNLQEVEQLLPETVTLGQLSSTKSQSRF